MLEKTVKQFGTMDVYLSAFLSLEGLDPILENNNGRITFNFPADDDLYKLMGEYNGNKAIPIVDFVTRVKTLRGQMLTMRGTR